jgi:hypothetical protein
VRNPGGARWTSFPDREWAGARGPCLASASGPKLGASALPVYNAVVAAPALLPLEPWPLVPRSSPWLPPVRCHRLVTAPYSLARTCLSLSVCRLPAMRCASSAPWCSTCFLTSAAAQFLSRLPTFSFDASHHTAHAHAIHTPQPHRFALHCLLLQALQPARRPVMPRSACKEHTCKEANSTAKALDTRCREASHPGLQLWLAPVRFT